MTTKKDFNKEIKEMCLIYGYVFKPSYNGQIRYVGNTPFGEVELISVPTPKLKLYTVFMRFLEDFEIEYFFKYFANDGAINAHSKKWNLHDSNPEYVLDEVDMRLSNLSQILKRDGKVCGTEYKPFIS